jgi:hypothetical protein
MSGSFIDTALEEAVCMKCDASLWAGHSGGFLVKLDRILLSKFQELEIQLGGGSTYRLDTTNKGTIARHRSLMDLRSGINKTQPLIVSLHVCKESDIKDATIPF